MLRPIGSGESYEAWYKNLTDWRAFADVVLDYNGSDSRAAYNVPELNWTRSARVVVEAMVSVVVAVVCACVCVCVCVCVVVEAMVCVRVCVCVCVCV